MILGARDAVGNKKTKAFNHGAHSLQRSKWIKKVTSAVPGASHRRRGLEGKFR
jgi:hypothetical protein